MASAYDDDLWRLVPDDPGPPPPQLAAFVEGLGHVGAALGGQAMAMAPRPGVAVGPDRVLFRLPLVRAGAGVTVDF